ncbi:MAG TPA: panthothenate synthetase [Verrucomicrobiae bacterium]|nr:panthothenate synthetase [Verrucomicrobiae bacterium]
MRILMIISIPHHTFNAAVKDGSVGAKMKKILDAQKPEAAYFTELDGKRTGILVVNMDEASQIPSLAEPWFLTFEADVQFRPTMVPADLERAGLDRIGKQWA